MKTSPDRGCIYITGQNSFTFFCLIFLFGRCNNTLYFHKNNKWNGINIEPIKKVYDKLIINRPNDININCAVCNYDGKTEFICNTGYTEMISGIKDTYDYRHYNRLNNENTLHRPKRKMRQNKWLKENNIIYIS